jgi:hypothetical protein
MDVVSTVSALGQGYREFPHAGLQYADDPTARLAVLTLGTHSLDSIGLSDLVHQADPVHKISK